MIRGTRVDGGVPFEDSHEEVGSIEHGSRMSVPLSLVGVLLSLSGVVRGDDVGRRALALVAGLVLVGYADWRRRQVLRVHGSDGTTLSLTVTKDRRIDEFPWYLRAERYRPA